MRLLQEGVKSYFTFPTEKFLYLGKKRRRSYTNHEK